MLEIAWQIKTLILQYPAHQWLYMALNINFLVKKFNFRDIYILNRIYNFQVKYIFYYKH